jgi:hypothetical protein
MRRFEVLGVWWESSGERIGCGVVIVLVELPVSAFVSFFSFSSVSFGPGCAAVPVCLYRVVAILI